ncbi:hypothetical protein [Actinoplanes sp. NPDC026670]|uniref:hypothetical protein n=1 Tax=Actinoplanes sp. NPDC026670 TaxID=3154700 RepID=UPI0033C9BE1F
MTDTNPPENLTRAERDLIEQAAGSAACGMVLDVPAGLADLRRRAQAVPEPHRPPATHRRRPASLPGRRIPRQGRRVSGRLRPSVRPAAPAGPRRVPVVPTLMTVMALILVAIGARTLTGQSTMSAAAGDTHQAQEPAGLLPGSHPPGPTLVVEERSAVPALRYIIRRPDQIRQRYTWQEVVIDRRQSEQWVTFASGPHATGTRRVAQDWAWDMTLTVRSEDQIDIGFPADVTAALAGQDEPTAVDCLRRLDTPSALPRTTRLVTGPSYCALRPAAATVADGYQLVAFNVQDRDTDTMILSAAAWDVGS